MSTALRAAVLLALLAPLPAVSSSPQGTCTTGCKVAFHLGMTEDATYGPDGESVLVAATSTGGDCVPVLGDDSVICVSSGCATKVAYEANGLAPGIDVWECHAKTQPTERTDCDTPPKQTDANGNFLSPYSTILACGSGESTMEIKAGNLSAQVRLVCEACDP